MGGCSTRLAGHDGPVLGAAWLAGGAVATAGVDGTIRVWTAEGALRCASTPLGNALLGVTAAPDGRSIVARAEGPVSGVWDAGDCRLRHRLDTRHESTLVAVVSPDGSTALLGGLLPDESKSGSGAYLVDLASGAMRPLPVADRMIVAGAFDPGGRRAVTSSIDSAIDLWDVKSGRRVGVVTGPPAAAAAIAFDPTGQLLLGGSADGIVRIWDAATGELVGSRTGHQAGIYLLRVRPDGAQIATAGHGGVAAPVAPVALDRHCRGSDRARACAGPMAGRPDRPRARRAGQIIERRALNVPGLAPAPYHLTPATCDPRGACR